MGRALLELPREPLCRTFGKPGGHDKLGFACLNGNDHGKFSRCLPRHRLADRTATHGRFVAKASRQWRLLRICDAGLPPVQDVLSGLGACAPRYSFFKSGSRRLETASLYWFHTGPYFFSHRFSSRPIRWISKMARKIAKKYGKM